ncbi:MAG: MgtC/SapB family protein [Acutalibacteraceae bacterium]|nr:MgtC/SapB family protein [Bacillota bacterium]
MFDHVNLFSVTLRLALSLVMGGLLGMEREQKQRPAGFRTYMLVCMGSALVMLTGQYVAESMNMDDVMRMGAQVVSGVGFLGAGTIIVTGHQQVKGLTTAAGIWASACLGLAVGIGFYSGAIVGCALILLVLKGFHFLEQRISQRSRVINVFAELESLSDLGILLQTARKNFLTVTNVDISWNKKKSTEIVVLFSVG